MLNVINIERPLIVNGVQYANSADALLALQSFTGDIEIRIDSPMVSQSTSSAVSPNTQEPVQIYEIKVRQYMTKKSSADFDFMKKFNNDVPMPLRVMCGEILQETKGMYRMRLNGFARYAPDDHRVCCMRCGKDLKNPVSRYFGMGIECINHYPISITEADMEAIEDGKKIHQIVDADLKKVQWEGWVIKSAIEEMNKV